MRKINTLSFKRATRRTSREINRQIVLNLVREHQPISRADLARRMKIGRGLVTSLVYDLIDDGVIYEGATADAPRGRRPTMLYLRTRDRLVVAVDVRLTRTYIMLSDFAGTQITLESFETLLSPPELTAELVRRIRVLLRKHRGKGRCEGIGLVVPGMVDRESGRILHTPQLGWRDVDIRTPIAAQTGLPVAIENAPIACALAQMWLGRRLKEASDFVYVTVSDGVGTGLVVNGQVVRGHDNSAGEFGHIPLDLDGPPCLCGGRGCWEAYTSNLATLSRYLGRELPGAISRTLLQSLPITMPELIDRARSGESRALAALHETARYLGLGMAVITNALNPAQIVVGGEITAAWEEIEPMIRGAVTERALTRAAGATPIVPEETAFPRLRGATALVAAPLFAAPQVA